MDWIESFASETPAFAPESYRLWAGISCVAAALERRTYTYTYKGILYPNLYVFLAGGPGSGKSLMINESREMFSQIPDVKLGPDNPTRRSFLNSLQESIRPVSVNGFDFNIFSSLYLASRELIVFMSKYDTNLIGDLSDIYDNPDSYKAPRATVTSVEIERPTLNILGGVTPNFISEIFPEIAWGQGFTSRLLLIYGTKVNAKGIDLFERPDRKQNVELVKSIKEIALLNGEFVWTDDAQLAFNKWRDSGLDPVPTYERLHYYCERREAHIFKLAMVSAASRTHSLTVELDDFIRAKEWLLSAEASMPDVFRAVSTKSDYQLIQDMHQHFWSIYSSLAEKKRVPIPESLMKDWLTRRTTTDKIQRVFDAAVSAGYFEKSPMFPLHWIPKRLDQVGDLL